MVPFAESTWVKRNKSKTQIAFLDVLMAMCTFTPSAFRAFENPTLLGARFDG